jgi:hypothetical protein
MKFKNYLKLFSLVVTLLAAIGACIGAENLTVWALSGLTYAVLAVAEELNHE